MAVKVYAGSVTSSWVSPGGTFIFSGLTQLEFNAVRLENITITDSTHAPITFDGPVFVSVDGLGLYCSEFTTVGRRSIVGGCSWNTSGLDCTGNHMRPLKMTSTSLDKLRSNTFTCTLLDAYGRELTLPGSSFVSVTISFWQVNRSLSTL